MAALGVAQAKTDTTITVHYPIALNHYILRPSGSPFPKVHRVFRNARLTDWNSNVPEQVVPHNPINPFVDVYAASVILVSPARCKLEQALFNATVSRPNRVTLTGRSFDELLIAIQNMAVMDK